MSDLKNIRVRFAPSPTGALHIGGVRTALYNYLFAKKNNGKLILRIEDTDSKRFVEGAEKYIIDSLNWLGIEIDEGIGSKNDGPYSPYRQSERREIYKKYCNELLEKGKAYIAFDTPEQLEEKRKEIKNFQYDSTTRTFMSNSLTLSKEEVERKIENKENYVVRFKVTPNEDITINDIIRGKVTINSSVLDDKVIYKSADELPTYHLANIVDDHLMKISHVIRGEEWLPSAPLHILLYKAFGWEETMPQFAHLPLLLKPEGNGKLSKRDGDKLGFPVFPCDWIDPKTGEKSSGYREAGYFPEAVVNFIALLGWHPGTNQEMLSMDELIEQFDLSKCSKAGAKFDYEKGKWFNHQYLENKSDEDLLKLFLPILEKHNISKDAEYVKKVISLVKERANFVNDLWDQSSFFFERPTTYTAKKMKKFWKAETPEIMKELIEQLELLPNLETKETEEKICSWIEEKNYKMGLVLNGFRMSLVGEGKGPHIFDISEMLGKEETIIRINNAIENIKLA